MTEHPDQQLSAYLDEALASDERAAVRAHIDGCARCAARLAELRATSRLIAALPTLMPGRSLVPRLERAPVWLRPVRLLGAMGTGVFAFLFLASYVLNSGSSLGGGTTEAERLAQKGQFGAAANAIASDAANKKGPTTAGSSAAPAAAPLPAGAAASTPKADSVTQRSSTVSPPPQDTGASPTYIVYYQYGPPPATFLGIALLCAAIAFVAHRRLRRS
ncbi:MAG TPA: zf-HC2 domain-containing protein [Candidatus Limnocylindria bacterium]